MLCPGMEPTRHIPHPEANEVIGIAAIGFDRSVGGVGYTIVHVDDHVEVGRTKEIRRTPYTDVSQVPANT